MGNELKPYSLEFARTYWSYPPCKTYGKKHTGEYCDQSDLFIKNLMENEIEKREEAEGANFWKSRVAGWIKKNGIKKILDFGCGLGQDGLYFALKYGVEITFADISSSNIKLTERFNKIWKVETKSIYVDNPETFDPKEKFGLILINGVLHHTPRTKEIIANLEKYLEFNGLFVVMLYTEEHYMRVRAKNLKEYSERSEIAPPIQIINQYSDYYNVQKTLKLFPSYSLIDDWKTFGSNFGWYCFKKREIKSNYGKDRSIPDFYGQLKFKNRKDLWNYVDGKVYIGDNEIPELCFFASRAKKTIVEIGAGTGSSAILFLTSAPKTANIYSIDPFVHDHVGGQRMSRKICEDNVKKALEVQNMTGSLKRWNIIEKPSQEATKNWKIPIDLLFIDGDHRYEAVCKDFEDWFPYLKKGGVMLLHDSCMIRFGPSKYGSSLFARGHVGPTDLAKELRINPKLKLLEKVWTLTIWRKN